MVLNPIATRAIAGVVVASIIAVSARRLRALSWSGAGAAVVTGAVCMAAGWDWGTLLIVYFLVSSALSKHGEREKHERTGDVVDKGGARDATQVIANGGLFSLMALMSLLAPPLAWIAHAAGAGALAASAADTWATEIGTLSRAQPRSLISFARVTPGTSGGITLPGTLGMVAGSAFIAALVFIAGWGRASVVAAVFGGIAGALADSLLGATVQARRWCPTCERETERVVHACGTATREYRGIAWLDNDVVNFVSTGSGALVSLACVLFLSM